MEKQKEKVKTAVAIAYEPGEEAPKILATGKGLIAERIIVKSKRRGCAVLQGQQISGQHFQNWRSGIRSLRSWY